MDDLVWKLHHHDATWVLKCLLECPRPCGGDKSEPHSHLFGCTECWVVSKTSEFHVDSLCHFFVI